MISLSEKYFAPLLTINILMGLLLWVMFWSDIEWNNTWVNVFFPILVTLIGTYSFFWKRKTFYKQKNRFKTLCVLPSLFLGVSYIISLPLFIISPFSIASYFWKAEQDDSVLIQQTNSPDGKKIADVYFYPVGAYSGGSGRVRIYLRYKGFPMFRRHIAFVKVTHIADQNTTDYVNWKDDQIIYLPEFKADLKTNRVQWVLNLYWPLMIPWYFSSYFY